MGKPLILVVNPDKEQLKTIKTCLINEQFNVNTAISSTDALLCMKEKPANIFISDEDVPDYGGIELLRTIKTRYPHTVRCIIGNDTPSNNIFHSRVEKPWALEELITKVRDCEDHYQTIEANRESMQIILSASREDNSPRQKDLILSTALLNVLSLAAVVVDESLNVVICNDIYNLKIAAEMNRQDLPEDLKSLFRNKLGETWVEFRISYSINDTKYHIRLRPLRTTDSKSAILFFDPVGPLS